MRILLVHVTIPESQKYLRSALDRVVAMNKAFDGEANDEILYLELAAAFFHKEPSHLLYVGVDESEKIVVHGYASIQDYYGTKSVMCHQLWRNVGSAKFEPGQLEKALDSIAKWGKSQGAKVMRTYAYNAQVVKAAEVYGWKRTDRVLMERKIDNEE